MAKKNPSVDVATRASQALQAGVAPSMLHRHLGVALTYADRREATVQPSGRAVTVFEFGLPRGAHSALAVVTGQRAGEYEVFLVRDGERELPVSGGKVAVVGAPRRNRGVARRNPLPDWPGAAGAYKRALAALEKWNASEAAAQRRAHRGAKSTFRYSPPEDIRQWTKALDDGDEEMIKYFLTVREPDWNTSARANPRFKHLSDEADALIDADVARIKSDAPDVAACLSDAGAWGHVFQVLTYLRGHGMDMTAASFRDAVMRRDLHGVHLDDRVLGAGFVGKNAYNRTSGAQAAKAFRELRELCSARANSGRAPETPIKSLKGWSGGAVFGKRIYRSPDGLGNSVQEKSSGWVLFVGGQNYGPYPSASKAIDAYESGTYAPGTGGLVGNPDPYRSGKSYGAERQHTGLSAPFYTAWYKDTSGSIRYLPDSFATSAQASRAAKRAAGSRRNSGMAPLSGDMGFGGPGAPSMFNNMSDVLQGNVGRRNSGSPFAVNDRVTMRAGHHTGMGSPNGTVTHPGSSRSLVRFDDGTLVDVENRALVPLRRNLGDGPPPPPPVGNPHGWATLTLDNAYDNAPLRSKDHPEWGEKRLRYEGSEGRGYWTHWSNHGSAVLPEGEFRFWEIKGGSEGSRGKGYAHRYPRARANPLRRNHHLHPGDRVSMGDHHGTVDQQVPGTYDTYQVSWDRGGTDRVEGHKLRKVSRNPAHGYRRNLGDGPPPPPPVGNPYTFVHRRNVGDGSFPAPVSRLPRGHTRSNPASQREPTDPFIDVTVAEGRVRAYDPRDKNKWFNFYVTNSNGVEARYALHTGHGRNATPYWGSNDTPPSWVLRVLKQNNFDWREA